MPAVLASWLACRKMEVNANVAQIFLFANKLRDFVCTLPPMVADGAGIEIVFIVVDLLAIGRKKNGCHLPLLTNLHNTPEVR